MAKKCNIKHCANVIICQDIQEEKVYLNLSDCKYCGMRIGIGTPNYYHKIKCPTVPKCEYCRCRTDIIPVCHSSECPFAPTKYKNTEIAKNIKKIEQRLINLSTK